jgi:integrase
MTLNVLAPVQIAAGVCEPGPKGADGNPTALPRYGLHDFRHAAASLWIEQRVSPKRIQAWMGHSSIQVTFDTYGHLFEAADQDYAVAAAVERELLGGADGTRMQHGG